MEIVKAYYKSHLSQFYDKLLRHVIRESYYDLSQILRTRVIQETRQIDR